MNGWVAPYNQALQADSMTPLALFALNAAQLPVCIGLTLARDRWIAAARLAGAASAARRRLGLPTESPGRGPLDSRVEQIRRHLGDQAFHTALREGEALSLEEATGYILAEVLDS